MAEAYRRLDPIQSVDPNCEFYCHRPEKPLDRLELKLKFADRPGVYLVSGHIGAGKTTELTRILKGVPSQFAPIYIPVDSVLDATSVDERLFLALIGMAIDRLSYSPDREADEICEDFHKKLNSAHQYDEAQRELSPNDLMRRAKRYRDITDRAPIVVLDGFDKVPLAQIERLFTVVRRWETVPVTIVVTVPMSFMFTPFSQNQTFFDETAVVPSILVERERGEPDYHGYRWFRKLLQLRRVDRYFARKAIDSLVYGTGGIIRSFLRAAREAVLTSIMDSQS